MAKLISERCTLEINFFIYSHGWIYYEIGCFYDGKHILNNELVKKTLFDAIETREGYFYPCHGTKDYILFKLNEVVKGMQPVFWEPEEPNIIIAFYPEMYFPFINSNTQIIYESEEKKRFDEAIKARKADNPIQPDDTVTIIVFIDSYNFKDNIAFGNIGASFHMVVERKEIIKFSNQLLDEYKIFYNMNKSAFIREFEEWGINESEIFPL